MTDYSRLSDRELEAQKREALNNIKETKKARANAAKLPPKSKGSLYDPDPGGKYVKKCLEKIDAIDEELKRRKKK